MKIVALLFSKAVVEVKRIGLEGREVDEEKIQGVYSSSDDRTNLTFRCAMQTFYIGPRVAGSG